MELNKYMIDEIMSLPTDDESLVNSINMLVNDFHLNVEILMNDKYEPYYNVLVKDILNSNMEADDLILISSCGWILSEDKESIIKFC